MIPRILHFVWTGRPMPDWAEAMVERWRTMNPGHEVRVHGREVLLPQLERAAATARRPAQLADLLRLSALARYGGWYVDTDFWPLRPLDDAIRNWGLTGEALFLARQVGQKGAAHAVSNGVLAARPDARALARLVALASEASAERWTSLGPDLVKGVAHQAGAGEVILAEGRWWFPVDWNEGRMAYGALSAGRDLSPLLRSRCGGCLPYAVHLWAGGRDLERPRTRRHPQVLMGRVKAERLDDPGCFWGAAAAGLRRLGYSVEAVERYDVAGMLADGLPAAVVAWNGRRAPHAGRLARLREYGVPLLWTEHGFFDRGRCTQIDTEGILHWASWRRHLGDEPPEGTAERLDRWAPERRPVVARTQGYVLALGQVAGDAQLEESEVQAPWVLEKVVGRALRRSRCAGTRPKAYMRDHPQCGRSARHRAKLARLGDEASRADYRATKHGMGLAAALEGARLVVTVNSNAITEALVAGVPCLAMGPSLAVVAGAARGATRATLPEDLEAMLGGWAPDPDAVERYLGHLAAHQWAPEELADGRVLARLLAEAGADVPAIRPVEAAEPVEAVA